MDDKAKPTMLAPIEELKSNIIRLTPEFKKALPPQIPVEKFVRVVLTAIQTNPAILEADRASLFASCVKAASDGLLPDGREAALVTFNTKAGLKVQYMPMVNGILKKVRNSGELKSINAQVVYEGDEFDYWLDHEGEHLKHRPKFEGDSGNRRLTYAIATTKDGAVYVEVMTESQIQDVREVSKAKDSGPWSGPFADEMRRKTAIRRLSKRLPMSTDLEQVIQRDDELYSFKPEVSPAATGELRRLNEVVSAITKEEPREVQDSGAKV